MKLLVHYPLFRKTNFEQWQNELVINTHISMLLKDQRYANPKQMLECHPTTVQALSVSMVCASIPII